MKILNVATFAPPDFTGGLERSMWSLAVALSRQHRMFVVACARSAQDEEESVLDGIRIIRRRFPRSLFPGKSAGSGNKWYFHFADHLARANRLAMGRVLDDLRPDFIIVHTLVGIGHNVLLEFGARNLPVLYYLHDLGPICVNRAMFRSGRNCAGWCVPCRASARLQSSYMRRVRRIGFASPSRANIDAISKRFLLPGPAVHLPNANRYPEPHCERTNSSIVRLILIGRISPEKGGAFVLSVLDALAADWDFRVTLVGDGPALSELREQYGARSWCSFTGWLGEQEISNLLAQHDALLLPSLWAENSPGVAIHALSLGVPVIASSSGGIPELVQHDRNGLLAPPGDFKAWAGALISFIRNGAMREKLSAGAATTAQELDPVRAAARIEDFIMQIAGS